MTSSARHGWPEVTLGEVCQFAYGKSLPKTKRSGFGFQVFGSNGPVGLHDEAVTAGETIIVGRKGSLGEVHYSEKACFPIDTTYYVSEKETDAYLPWLARRLRCLDLNKLNRAAAIPGLNRSDAYRQKLLFPPLAEQKRIALILDAADALRARRRESLAQLDALLQSTFLDLFGDPVTNPKGWPIVRSADLYSGNPRIGTVRPARGEGYLVVRVGEVGDSTIRFEDCGRVELTQAEFDRFRLEAGDTVIARAIGSKSQLGKASFFGGYKEEVVIDSHVMRLRPDVEMCNPKWFYSLISSERGKFLLQQKGGATAVQFNINAKQANDLDIPTPPLQLQHKFATIVEAVERQKARLRAHLAELDALFASLEARAFNGEL